MQKRCRSPIWSIQEAVWLVVHDCAQGPIAVVSSDDLLFKAHFFLVEDAEHMAHTLCFCIAVMTSVSCRIGLLGSLGRLCHNALPGHAGVARGWMSALSLCRVCWPWCWRRRFLRQYFDAHIRLLRWGWAWHMRQKRWQPRGFAFCLGVVSRWRSLSESHASNADLGLLTVCC